jgi:peptidyl-prolyl cis-trans isomerase D
MIGTIRKHSKWLWWIIAGLTIVSFVVFMGSGPSRNRSGGFAAGDYGSIYGSKISQQEFADAQREFALFYLFRTGRWPDRNPNLSEKDKEEQIYLRMLLLKKAEQLGIYISDEAAVNAGNAMLHSTELQRALGTSQGIRIDAFVKQVLQPEGLTIDDFKRFAKDDLIIQQVVQALGLTGELVTPQEAAMLYERERQEQVAQIVFFSATNYLSRVAITPGVIGQFYTNEMAAYRQPDRRSVSYVEFNITNFLPQAKAWWAKTNLEEAANAILLQYGAKAFPTATNEADAKAQARELVIRQRALADARKDANDLANAVYGMTPVAPGNLATVAKQNGLTAVTTAPFAADFGPAEFTAPADFTKRAFELTAEDPFAGPIVSPTGVYVIALDKLFPSGIPPLDEIRARVTADYQNQVSAMFAQHDGTNFVANLFAQLATGHSFASVCVNAGHHPEVLPPFSLATEELPTLAGRAALNQIKQVALTTSVGHASAFVPTEDGGFILFLEKRLPVDPKTMQAEMPEFLGNVRRARQSEAFNQWLQLEANRQLRTTPLYTQKAAAK